MFLDSRSDRLSSMERPLLILDLDETLVYASETPLDRPADFHAGRYHVYRRPHLKEFLSAAFDGFEVAVWSSASSSYVQAIVAVIFPDPERLHFVWSESRCTQRYHPELMDYYWLKNLQKVKRLGYPLARVVMLDDSPEKLERHYGNHLPIAPFMGNPEDTQLRDILPFLNHLRGVENMRTVEKRSWRRFTNTVTPY
jgi:TFIIF-interacting CTD phosphatase-like protein